jgi:hypothetical protein
MLQNASADAGTASPGLLVAGLQKNQQAASCRIVEIPGVVIRDRCNGIIKQGTDVCL